MQIVTEELYVVVNIFDWKNHKYGNLPRYSYTSFLEALASCDDGQTVVSMADFIAEIISNHEIDIVDEFDISSK